MRRYNIPTLASGVAARNAITAEDVAVLRKNLFNGEEVWPHEARALFDLMQKRLPACDEWDAFIVEAISEYVVNELEPRGSLDDKNARWLSAMMARDRDGWCETDLELLVAVMDKVGSAPIALQHFALEVTQTMMAGCRPAAAADTKAPAATAHDAEILPMPARKGVAA